MRHVSLGIALFGFWLLLSGHYTQFLLTIGALCCIGVVLLARQMKVVDAEGHPIHLVIGALTYWPWLVKEIIKSAWDVTKIIINPALPISPTLMRARATQKTALGVNIYANSITLTPGTISVEVDDHDIVVHALQGEGADALAEGAMDRRVTRFEGAR